MASAGWGRARGSLPTARLRIRNWRRGWDSNPRWGCPHIGFRDRRLQPSSATSPGWFVERRMAVPTGFEPAFSALTGPRVGPGYTTGPAAEKFSSNAVPCPGALGDRNRRDPAPVDHVSTLVALMSGLVMLSMASTRGRAGARSR